MKSLNDGVVTFREQDYEIHRELFQELGRKQNPHTLFIGCSDSRIVPNLMTNTLPGELFVCACGESGSTGIGGARVSLPLPAPLNYACTDALW
jgi:hypothetical protein